ncbi:DNA replication/repair protein RecF [Oleiagrimonas sp. C23AA]|uniref:DNA replication/repair protein RecF n=1 Tax=Oleiagrimonas sp. C23AA TaxID=2719047 RepID=UPI00141F8A08|nr:DNA replication/repair protein RecF [Oleiagrimonas sp. C23AA]
MLLKRLHIQGLRSLSDVELTLGAGMNVFVGANGAGKTSVLEAAYLLSHGRSFRAGTREVLVQRGGSRLSVFGEVQSGALTHRLGLGREGVRWQVRLDGSDAPTLGELVRHCAVVCFEPGSHALIAGPAEERRRFLDWGVFHVEHDFVLQWRRYQRALKQRNRLLRMDVSLGDAQFDAWEAELESSGTAVDAYRRAYLHGFEPELVDICADLLGELGTLQLRYRRGWADDRELGRELRERRERDKSRGHTAVGIHRADWSPVFESAPQREHLSRGQEKLCALACTLAQAEYHAGQKGEWPIICLDDLASELDAAHQVKVVTQLRRHQAQVLVTGTELPTALEDDPGCVFHVEQGTIRPLL